MTKNKSNKYPYPGYSWSITQHVAPATETKVIYELLNAAHIFGKLENYQDKITDYILEHGYLTANIREDQGKPQLWRDYQQVLPELGLIISTRFTKDINITPIGLQWLDGLIGYSELVTTQLLSYQYPNGHKQTLSPTNLKKLKDAKISPPSENRVVLDNFFGVSIKPAVLILRILYELAKKNDFDGIKISETVYALMPIKTNSDWKLALNNLKDYRDTKSGEIDNRRKRHVQEWFRLLELTDLFTLSDDYRDKSIKLSEYSVSHLDEIKKLLSFHENSQNFWLPESENSKSLGISWFNYFGSPQIERQWVHNELSITSEYLESNYPEGINEEEDNPQINFSNPDINLVEYSSSDTEPENQDQSDIDVDIDKLKKAHEERASKTRLHEKIVAELAEFLKSNGYQVYEDRNSVDLLAIRDHNELIFEIKTISKKNFKRHVRLGIGQLQEYSFRRYFFSKKRPNSILVLSSVVNLPEWYAEFFQNDLGFDLICYSNENTFEAKTSSIKHSPFYSYQ